MEQLFADHRRWVDQHIGNPEKPWFILCSAPSPTVPQHIPDDTIFVCVNSSGLTAHNLGLRFPDLTIRAEKKPWKEIYGLQSNALLWISKKSILFRRLRNPTSFRHKVNAVRRIGFHDRDNIMRYILKNNFPAHGAENKPSNGLFALSYALICGATHVTLAGFSLTESGHSYNVFGKHRKHIGPDKAGLISIANSFNVSTTEKHLSDITGLKLYGSKSEFVRELIN